MARLSNSKKHLGSKKEINNLKRGLSKSGSIINGTSNGGAGELNDSSNEFVNKSSEKNNNNVITRRNIQENSTPNHTILNDNANYEPRTKDIIIDSDIKGKIERLISDVKTDHAIFTEYKTILDIRKNVTGNLINLLLKKLQMLESQSSVAEVNQVNKEIRIFLLDNELSNKSDDLSDESFSDKALIQKLKDENNALRKKLAEMTASADSLSKSTVKNYENIIEKKEIITDMLESICGLSISEVDESDPNNLIFDCTQSGINGEISYKLSLCRTDDQNKLNGEAVDDDDELFSDSGVIMVYTPLFESTDDLKQILPEYFFESLTFPVETLPQFYQKLSRALNRSNQ